MTPDTRILNDIDEGVGEVVNEVCDEKEKPLIKRQIIMITSLIILLIDFLKCCNKNNISIPPHVPPQKVNDGK